MEKLMIQTLPPVNQVDVKETSQQLELNKRDEKTEKMPDMVEDDRIRKDSTLSRSSGRSRHKSGGSRSNSKSSERKLPNTYNGDICGEQVGIYLGEYKKHDWVFVGEITSMSTGSRQGNQNSVPTIQRSASTESTQSEREFTKKYQEITHRMVHRKSSAIMYSRILERTFECNTIVSVKRVNGEFGFRIHGSRPVVVSAIEPNTPAESSGLSVGDILLTINDVNVLDLPHSQVFRVAQKCTEILQLGVARTDDESVEERSAESIWNNLSESKEVLAQGYMWKKKRSVAPNHKWSSRWFVLRADDCLYSFKSEEELKPSGALMLPGCVISNCDQTNQESGRENNIQITRPDGTVLLLSADSPEYWLEWRDLLNIAASRRLQEYDIWIQMAQQRATMSALSHESPDCRGVLYQFEGQISGESIWTRKMIVLMDGCLYIHKDQDQDQGAKAVIFLHGYKAQSGCSIGSKRHAFEMIPTDPNLQKFYFHGQTETEKKRWLAALEYSIDRWMRLS